MNLRRVVPVRTLLFGKSIFFMKNRCGQVLYCMVSRVG